MPRGAIDPQAEKEEEDATYDPPTRYGIAITQQYQYARVKEAGSDGDDVRVMLIGGRIATGEHEGVVHQYIPEHLQQGDDKNHAAYRRKGRETEYSAAIETEVERHRQSADTEERDHELTQVVGRRIFIYALRTHTQRSAGLTDDARLQELAEDGAQQEEQHRPSAPCRIQGSEYVHYAFHR